MKKLLQIFYPVLIPLLLTACAVGSGTAPTTFSDAQRRSMQVRTHDASYDSVFYAVKSVLLDDGYIVKSQDYAGGMILAEGAELKLPTGRADVASTGTADSAADDEGISAGSVLMGVGVFALAVMAAGNGGSPSYSGGGSNSERKAVDTSYQISINFDKINSKTTETRLVVQERTQYNMGNETLKEHIKPEIYKHLYDRIAHEIKRREALGR